MIAWKDGFQLSHKVRCSTLSANWLQNHTLNLRLAHPPLTMTSVAWACCSWYALLHFRLRASKITCLVFPLMGSLDIHNMDIISSVTVRYCICISPPFKANTVSIKSLGRNYSEQDFTNLNTENSLVSVSSQDRLYFAMEVPYKMSLGSFRKMWKRMFSAERKSILEAYHQDKEHRLFNRNFSCYFKWVFHYEGYPRSRLRNRNFRSCWSDHCSIVLFLSSYDWATRVVGRLWMICEYCFMSCHNVSWNFLHNISGFTRLPLLDGCRRQELGNVSLRYSWVRQHRAPGLGSRRCSCIEVSSNVKHLNVIAVSI